jgi:putative ABC transport system substrate-binding protein
MARGAIASALLLALVAPFESVAQPSEKIIRVGLLSLFPRAVVTPWHQTFRLGLGDLGWVEGKNISFEYRYADGRRDRLPDLAADLVRLKVAVIVTSADSDTLAAKNATGEVPIVMACPTDPVAMGLIESLARPGRNVTGLSQMIPELTGKRLELLKEVVPGLSRLAVVWNPDARFGAGPRLVSGASPLSWNHIQRPARELGTQLHSLETRSLKDFARVFEDAAKARVGAVLITPDVLYATNIKRLAELAAHSRLPSIYHLREFADAGGLMTYGTDRSDLYRRAATYVDKILKGSKPSDLPVEQPTKLELVINMKTARALGLTIPPSLLLRADQVIDP